MEIWKNVEGYEDLYQVSDKGNVKSLDRYRNYKNTKRFLKGRLLKFGICKDYFILTLSKNKSKKNYRVHRLVAQAFIPNPENKPYVNHKDGNKTNNHVDNLEWVTAKENTFHMYNILKVPYPNKGKSWENHNFSYEECINMIKLYKKGYSFRKISRLYNSNHKTISKIIRNEKYNN